MSRSCRRERLMLGSRRKTVSPKRARSSRREWAIVAIRRPAPPVHLPAEGVAELLEERLAAAPGAATPSATCRWSNPARPAGRPAAACGRCGPGSGPRRKRRAAAARPAGPPGRPPQRLVQDHQIDVAVGGDVAAAVAAVGDQGDVRRATPWGRLRRGPPAPPRPAPGARRRGDWSPARRPRRPEQPA